MKTLPEGLSRSRPFLTVLPGMRVIDGDRALKGKDESADHAALTGSIVGRYKLVSLLGRGGSGTVYLGERADRQYSAQVAVKIVDREAVHGRLGARFRAERQILASLNHPNIARLIDAGEIESGHPYLIMEYIHGEPLDRYCDGRRLSIEARLRLFLLICSAVQYAHQNLIVHRDVKPANILVTPDGTPKLLDFGIAKLLHSGTVDEAEALTRVSDRLLTPEYASPEQIRGETVTTSSDVYSLGIVLYELLAGVRPYKVAMHASQFELERTICLFDPSNPSSVFGAESKDALDRATIATQRGLPLDKLRKHLTGDLDAIVMKAMRKEPAHRFSSVEQLADDVRRYLAKEPVSARQGNWVYYAQRFTKRHVSAVATSAAFLVFVTGVAVVMSIQRSEKAAALEEAMLDRQRAESVSSFLLNVFSAADPYVHFGKEPSARDLLDRAAKRIAADLEAQPEVRTRLLEAIGRSYRRIGQPAVAIPYLQEALTLQMRNPQSQTKGASILTELAIAQRDAGNYDASDRTFTQALNVVRGAADTQTEEHGKLLVELGRLEFMRGNVTEAQGHVTLALKIIRNVQGENSPEVASVLTDLANILVWKDELAGAEQYARQAVHIYSTVHKLHPDRIIADFRLAQILLFRNQLDDAATLFERAIDAQRQVYGPNTSEMTEMLGSFAQVRLAQNKLQDAEKLLNEALTIHRNSGSKIEYQVGYLETILGRVLNREGRPTESIRVLRDAMVRLTKSLPADHQYIASAEYHLGEGLLLQGDLSAAEQTLRDSAERWTRSGAPAWRAARSRNAQGEAVMRQGRYDEATELLSSSLRDLEVDPAADGEAKATARIRLDALRRQAQTER
ncbi:MAG: protein kinase domain-containing protein [Povalibacter sp.]